MMIPWVGLGSAVTAALGLFGLYWYETLPKEEKEKADRAAQDYAKQLYGVGLDGLTSHQLSRVQGLVKQRFAA